MPHNVQRPAQSSIDGIRRFVASTPWMMLPGYLEAMLEVLQLRAAGTRFTEDEIDARLAAADHGALSAAGPAAGRPVSPSSGAIAVIPIEGIIAQKARMVDNASGPRGTSTEAITQAFDAAMADPAISAIVFAINSPGGTINGVPEAARHIFANRGTKRIIASVTGLGASAAYYLAAAADEISVTPSGEAGSIGVFMVHTDLSGALAAEGVKQTVIRAGKYKAEGHPAEPLGDVALAAMQGRVNEAYDMMVKDIAQFRAVPVATVRDGYGEGRVLGAAKSVESGMADRVATLDEVVSRLASPRGGAKPGTPRRSIDVMRKRIALDVGVVRAVTAADD